MRLWSLHPKYLDTKGLIACWRESLLAKAVILNQTKGYKFHPQLQRFQSHPEPLNSINQYLSALYKEACSRKYLFDKKKIGKLKTSAKINVTSGQILFELSHLKNKLWKRDRKKYYQLKEFQNPELHPLFNLIDGDVEPWERQK